MTFVPASSFEPATVVVSGTVAVSNFPASQPVTGPLTLAQLTAAEPLAVTGPLTAAQLVAAEPLAVSGPLTDAQLAARLPLTVGVNNFPASQAVTGPLTSAQLAALEPLSVTGPLTDAQLRAAAVPVSGPLTDTQLRATAVPVSAASLPLPTGAAKDSTLTDGTQRVGGTVTVDGSGHTQPVSGPLTNTELRAAAVDVDGSAVTQPISAESLPLPDGAADNDTLSELALTAIIERERMQLQ